LVTPNFDVEQGVWEQTVDLALQYAGGADQLRAAALFETDELEADGDFEDGEPLRVSESSIRELSLFDREAAGGAGEDETIAPEIESEDGGHHARRTARGALGAQVSGPHPEADVAAATRGSAAARERLVRLAHATLLALAAVLRRFADRLAPA
jgi:hypothetical protein